MCTGRLVLPVVGSIFIFKEYVASLIGVYKNNGAVSCVGIYFPMITSLAIPAICIYVPLSVPVHSCI